MPKIPKGSFHFFKKRTFFVIFLKNPKTYTEFVVFAVVVAIIDTSIDVVAVLVGAVVAGGATTVPLLKLTAPKLEVTVP